MTELFLKLSRDGMGRIFDSDSLLRSGEYYHWKTLLLISHRLENWGRTENRYISGVPTPPHFFAPLSTLLPLSSKMQQLLYPTHSTPKTETLIRPIYDEAITAFAELRGEWMRRSYRVLVDRVEQVDEGGIWEGGRGREKVRGLIGLWEVLVIILEVGTCTETILSTVLSRSFRPRPSWLPPSSPLSRLPPFCHFPLITR